MGECEFDSSLTLSLSLTPSKQVMDMRWDLGRWGSFNANYSSVLPKFGDTQHEFGLNQQFWYSSNLRIDVDAQRQTQSGDYNVGLRFSLPVF